MPAANVSISAEFEAITYKLTLPENGTVTASTSAGALDAEGLAAVPEGQAVKLTINTPTALTISSLKINDGEDVKDAVTTEGEGEDAKTVYNIAAGLTEDTEVAIIYAAEYKEATVNSSAMTYVATSATIKQQGWTALTEEGSVESDFIIKAAGNVSEAKAGYLKGTRDSSNTAGGPFNDNGANSSAVTLIKFDTTDNAEVLDNVVTATLTLHGVSGDNKNGSIHVLPLRNTSWDAATIVWNTANATPKDTTNYLNPDTTNNKSVSFSASNTDVSVDVSGLVTKGVVAFAVYSDNTRMWTISSPKLTLKTTDAELASYSITAATEDETAISTLESGVRAKYETFDVAGLPIAVKNGEGKYAVLNDSSVKTYGRTVTMGNEDTEVKLRYDIDESIVYYCEAENTGRLRTSDTNSTFSGGGWGAPHQNGLFVGAPSGATNGNTSTTFTAGTYKLEAYACGNADSLNRGLGVYKQDTSHTVLGTAISKAGTIGLKEIEFTLDADSTILISGNAYGQNAVDLDYFFIKTVSGE